MCSKHVEAWNKLIIKFSASSWLILRNKYIEMHSQQNIRILLYLSNKGTICINNICSLQHSYMFRFSRIILRESLIVYAKVTNLIKWKCWSRNRGSTTSTPFTCQLTSQGGTKTTPHNWSLFPAQFPSYLPTGSSTKQGEVFSSSTTNLTYPYLHFIDVLPFIIIHCKIQPTRKTIPDPIHCIYSHQPHRNLFSWIMPFIQ